MTNPIPLSLGCREKRYIVQKVLLPDFFACRLADFGFMEGETVLFCGKRGDMLLLRAMDAAFSLRESDGARVIVSEVGA